MLKHDNLSQRAYAPSFNPLLQDEGLYFANLNRAPKNAYTYAEYINTTYSYAGNVSRVQPQSTSEVFALYQIVLINSNERIEPAFESQGAWNRYGIIVATADSEGYYLVVTQSTNFVYPISEINGGVGFTYSSTSEPGFVYINSNGTYGPTLSDTMSSPTDTQIGSFPIGIITGPKSIAFFGTYRHFPSTASLE